MFNNLNFSKIAVQDYIIDGKAGDNKNVRLLNSYGGNKNFGRNLSTDVFQRNKENKNISFGKKNLSTLNYLSTFIYMANAGALLNNSKTKAEINSKLTRENIIGELDNLTFSSITVLKKDILDNLKNSCLTVNMKKELREKIVDVTWNANVAIKRNISESSKNSIFNAVSQYFEITALLAKIDIFIKNISEQTENEGYSPKTDMLFESGKDELFNDDNLYHVGKQDKKDGAAPANSEEVLQTIKDAVKVNLENFIKTSIRNCKETEMTDDDLNNLQNLFDNYMNNSKINIDKTDNVTKIFIIMHNTSLYVKSIIELTLNSIISGN